MNILVTFASKHGATQAIAERIGVSLRQYGLSATVMPTRDVTNLEPYDAVVLGSAVYFGGWMKDATAFVRHNQEIFARMPLWLFSSGSLGKPSADTLEPQAVTEFRKLGGMRDHQQFAGALRRASLDFPEKLIANAVHAPEGDFRDWAAIDDWASTIAHALSAPAAPLR